VLKTNDRATLRAARVLKGDPPAASSEFLRRFATIAEKQDNTAVEGRPLLIVLAQRR
jgi:hypothetical protein